MKLRLIANKINKWKIINSENKIFSNKKKNNNKKITKVIKRNISMNVNFYSVTI